MDDHTTPDLSAATLRAAVARFLSSPRCANPNTRRGYAATLDKLTQRLLHQLRHSAATTLDEKNTSLQLIMAKTPSPQPRTVLRYIKPGADAVTEVTELLGRRHPTPTLTTAARGIGADI